MSTQKVAVVVGASSGVGLSTAELLQRQGYDVRVFSRTHSEGLSRLGARWQSVDVTSEESVRSMEVPQVVDALVYCPGSITLKPVARLKSQEVLADFSLNALGALLVVQQMLPALKRSESAGAVFFSTVAVQTGMPFHTSVAMAKGALEGMVRALAAELASDKIRVNAVAPSLTNTPLASRLLSSLEKEEASARRHPLQRVGTSEEMARAALFLLESEWVTGQILAVDGGLSSLKMI